MNSEVHKKRDIKEITHIHETVVMINWLDP
jgi:hypothetical protein